MGRDCHVDEVAALRSVRLSMVICRTNAPGMNDRWILIGHHNRQAVRVVGLLRLDLNVSGKPYRASRYQIGSNQRIGGRPEQKTSGSSPMPRHRLKASDMSPSRAIGGLRSIVRVPVGVQKLTKWSSSRSGSPSHR